MPREVLISTKVLIYRNSRYFSFERNGTSFEVLGSI